MLLFCDEVFADGLSGTAPVYTAPSAVHAGAEKLFVSARISMASSNGALTIDSEHSADGVTWFTGATLISAGQFTTGAVTTLYGQDGGGSVRACYMRFKISFGSSIDGFVRVTVTGRSRLRAISSRSTAPGQASARDTAATMSDEHERSAFLVGPDPGDRRKCACAPLGAGS